MIRILVGDVRERLADLPDGSVQCVVTSPPYFGLRDYGTASWDGGDLACDHKSGRFERGGLSPKQASNNGSGGDEAGRECRKCGAVRVDNQIGLEPTLTEYIATLVDVFRDVRRVLHPTGCVFLNLGDSYAGSWGNQGRKEERGMQRPINGPMIQNLDPYPQQASNTGTIRDAGLKPKDLMMVPARVAIALVEDGWYLRSDIIWAKKNCMPESVTDRPTSSHEHIFLLTKQARYFYDSEAVREAYAPATFERLNQATFHQQNGGAKDPGTGNRSARRALVNLKNNIPPAPQLEDSPENYNPAGRNQRNVWSLATEPFAQAHFATFPTEIPRRCIAAGTSEKGQCAACGAPWVRVVERQGYNGNGRADASVYTGSAYSNPQSAPRGPNRNFGEPTAQTTGWKPMCNCNGNVVPQTVLDPFLGSGTTLLVADRLGRNGVGIELNEDYARMAEQRIRGDAPMFADVAAD